MNGTPVRHRPAKSLALNEAPGRNKLGLGLNNGHSGFI